MVAVALLQTIAGDNFQFKFYGRVRADIFYNTRANNELVDGIFYLFPMDQKFDPMGNDLNATPQGNFYVLYSQVGVDVAGPMIGKAKTSAKIELDFRGSGVTYAMPRIRHAYVNLDWGSSALLVGQTWHPLFGEVSPSILNLSTGAPFQPFSRSPLIRYRYSARSGVQLSAYAIWQQQYTSAGPIGRSYYYLKNSCIPEFYLGLDYVGSRWRYGLGVEMLSLKPRTQSTVDGVVYKVSERVTSFSAEAHAKYAYENWKISAKTVLANNLTHANMIGGYGVTSENPITGERKYTPFHHTASWINVVYGKKWQPGIFIGYLKNLGTGKAITGEVYGIGTDVDQLLGTFWQISYNLPHWRVGFEFGTSTAWYGTTNLSNGKIIDTHSVSNYRFTAMLAYSF